MDFMMKFMKTMKGRDSIWVIVDSMTKSAHFIPVKISYPLYKLSELYMENVVSLNGIHLNIFSNRNPRFISRFWHSL